MSVILGRHKAACLCQFGDPTTDYPGLYLRPDNFYIQVGAYTYSYVAFDNYPSTSPSEVITIIRRPDNSANPSTVTIVTGPAGSVDQADVTAYSPPSPISGSPFIDDYRSASLEASIFPRWTGETAWDLQSYSTTDAFTPAGLTTNYLDYNYPVMPDAARYGISYLSGYLPNDPTIGGYTLYQKQAQFKVFANADKVCCWNEGAQIVLNLEVWKIEVSATYVSGTVGKHTYTLGTASYETTLTCTVTVDPTFEGPGVHVATLQIPQVSGHFTWVNDVYVSSITGP